MITVQNLPITISKEDIDDYICITDIAAAKSDDSRAADVVRNWLRNRRTLEFLSTWEEIYNPNFKVFESEHFKKEIVFEFSSAISTAFKLYLIKEFEILSQIAKYQLNILNNAEKIKLLGNRKEAEGIL